MATNWTRSFWPERARTHSRRMRAAITTIGPAIRRGGCVSPAAARRRLVPTRNVRRAPRRVSAASPLGRGREGPFNVGRTRCRGRPGRRGAPGRCGGLECSFGASQGREWKRAFNGRDSLHAVKGNLEKYQYLLTQAVTTFNRACGMRQLAKNVGTSSTRRAATKLSDTASW